MDSKPIPVGCSIALPLFFGGLVAVAGLLLILAGFNIIDVFPELPADGPRWVISVAGLPFFSWGVWIASGAFAREAGEDSLLSRAARHFLILSNLIIMAGIFLWGGFGPGERHFQVETTTGPPGTTSIGNPLIGRCIFNGVGIMMTTLSLLYIRNLLTGDIIK